MTGMKMNRKKNRNRTYKRNQKRITVSLLIFEMIQNLIQTLLNYDNDINNLKIRASNANEFEGYSPISNEIYFLEHKVDTQKREAIEFSVNFFFNTIGTYYTSVHMKKHDVFGIFILFFSTIINYEMKKNDILISDTISRLMYLVQ